MFEFIEISSEKWNERDAGYSARASSSSSLAKYCFQPACAPPKACFCVGLEARLLHAQMRAGAASASA